MNSAWCDGKLHRLFPAGLRGIAMCGAAGPALTGDKVGVSRGGKAV